MMGLRSLIFCVFASATAVLGSVPPYSEDRSRAKRKTIPLILPLAGTGREESCLKLFLVVVFHACLISIWNCAREPTIDRIDRAALGSIRLPLPILANAWIGASSEGGAMTIGLRRQQKRHLRVNLASGEPLRSFSASH